DAEHRLWVGTEQGLNRYNRNNDLFKRISNSNFGLAATDNMSVRSIIDDANGNLFIGTFGKGMYKMDSKSLKAIRVNTMGVDDAEALTVYVLAKDSKGQMYAATNHGILSYDEHKQLLQPAVFADGQRIDAATQTLVVDVKDNIWTGTSAEGLYKI